MRQKKRSEKAKGIDDMGVEELREEMRKRRLKGWSKLRLEELRRKLKEEVKSQMTLALVRRWRKPKEQEEEVKSNPLDEQPGRSGADCPHPNLSLCQRSIGILGEDSQLLIKPAKINVRGGVEDQTEVRLVDTNSQGRSEEESMGGVEGQAGGSNESREVIEVGEDCNLRGEQVMDTPDIIATRA